MPRARKPSPSRTVVSMIQPEKRSFTFAMRNRVSQLVRVRAIILDCGKEAGTARWKTEYYDRTTKALLHTVHTHIMPSEDRMLASFTSFIHKHHV